MIDTKTEVPRTTADPVNGDSVLELINSPGPCITVILPPYRPGEPGKSAAALLKIDLQELRKKLESRKIIEPLITELLDPIEELSVDKASTTGSEYMRGIFRSPTVLRQVELFSPRPCGHISTVGDCFNVRPLLASLLLPQATYVLDLTRDSVALLECGLRQVRAMELPGGIPKTLDEFLAFNPPDHDLINRSTAGPSKGDMRGVQFGTGSARERRRNHLHDFYRAVDRGIHELLSQKHAPLLLWGVDEDLVAYRSANTYPQLVEKAIPAGTGAPVDDAQILRKVHELASLDAERKAGLEMRQSDERLSPLRFSRDLSKILRAAAEGRVAQLYMDENAHRVGTFDGKIYGGKMNWHDEDLLNVAAVETLARSGIVYSLPTHQMDGAVVAAALRY